MASLSERCSDTIRTAMGQHYSPKLLSFKLVASLSKISQRLALGLILLLAAFLRFYRLDLMEFKEDEAQAAVLVVEAIQEGRPPTHGLMSSVGVYNPPGFIYLLLLPGLFSFDPIHLALFIALLNVGAVFLCYWFGRRMFNDRVALLSALLFAASPWAVIFSRKIWAQDCLPLFSLLVLGGTYELCAHGNRRWFLPAALSAFILPGIHFSGVYATVVFLLMLALFRPKVGWKLWLVVTLVCSALYVPYLMASWSPGGVGGSLAPSHFSGAAILQSLTIVSLFHFDYLLGASFERFQYSFTPFLWLTVEIAGALISIFFVAGFARLTVQVFRGRSRPPSESSSRQAPRAGLVACWLWVAAPILGYLLLSFDKPIYPHYLIILYPVPFWLVAAALDGRIGKNYGKWQKWVTWALILAAFCEVGFALNLFRFLAAEGGAAGDYGIIYQHKREAAEFIASSSAGNDAAAELSSPLRPSLLDYEYLLAFAAKANESPTHSETGAVVKFAIVETPRASPGIQTPHPERFLEKRAFGPVRVFRLRE